MVLVCVVGLIGCASTARDYCDPLIHEGHMLLNSPPPNRAELLGMLVSLDEPDRDPLEIIGERKQAWFFDSSDGGLDLCVYYERRGRCRESIYSAEFRFEGWAWTTKGLEVNLCVTSPNESTI